MDPWSAPSGFLEFRSTCSKVFVNDGEALGRPVGVAIARAGALLVADDVGNSVWRVAPSEPTMAENRNVGTDIR